MQGWWARPTITRKSHASTREPQDPHGTSGSVAIRDPVEGGLKHSTYRVVRDGSGVSLRNTGVWALGMKMQDPQSNCIECGAERVHCIKEMHVSRIRNPAQIFGAFGWFGNQEKVGEGKKAALRKVHSALTNLIFC